MAEYDPAAVYQYDDWTAEAYGTSDHEYSLTWDDVEVRDTQRVGDTQYTLGVVRGSEQQQLWAEYPWGGTEQVVTTQELGDRSVEAVWARLTDPDAPTDVSEQVRLQDAAVLDQRAQQLGILTDHEQELSQDGALPAAWEQSEQPLHGAGGHESPAAPEPDLDDDFDIDM